MSGFQIGVLIWLVFLTIRSFTAQARTAKVVDLLVEMDVLKRVETPTKKTSSTTTYVPPDRSDPDNNPFLKAGIEAIRQSKKKGSQDG